MDMDICIGILNFFWLNNISTLSVDETVVIFFWQVLTEYRYLHFSQRMLDHNIATSQQCEYEYHQLDISAFLALCTEKESKHGHTTMAGI